MLEVDCTNYLIKNGRVQGYFTRGEEQGEWRYFNLINDLMETIYVGLRAVAPQELPDLVIEAIGNPDQKDEKGGSRFQWQRTNMPDQFDFFHIFETTQCLVEGVPLIRRVEIRDIVDQWFDGE